MPTDYTKLRELCPALEKAEDEAARKFPPLVAGVVVDAASTVASDALAAQPDLAAEKAHAEQTIDRATKAGDNATANKAFIEAHEANGKAMDNLRGVCRAPSSPLMS